MRGRRGDSNTAPALNPDKIGLVVAGNHRTNSPGLTQEQMLGWILERIEMPAQDAENCCDSLNSEIAEKTLRELAAKLFSAIYGSVEGLSIVPAWVGGENIVTLFHRPLWGSAGGLNDALWAEILNFIKENSDDIKYNPRWARRMWSARVPAAPTPNQNDPPVGNQTSSARAQNTPEQPEAPLPSLDEPRAKLVGLIAARATKLAQPQKEEKAAKAEATRWQRDPVIAKMKEFYAPHGIRPRGVSIARVTQRINKDLEFQNDKVSEDTVRLADIELKIMAVAKRLFPPNGIRPKDISITAMTECINKEPEFERKPVSEDMVRNADIYLKADPAK
jgi:hypothetical protein